MTVYMSSGPFVSPLDGTSNCVTLCRSGPTRNFVFIHHCILVPMSSQSRVQGRRTTLEETVKTRCMSKGHSNTSRPYLDT